MMPPRRLVFYCTTLLVLNLALIAVVVKYGSLDFYHITINVEDNMHPNTVLPDDFLSFGVDASQVDNFAAMSTNKRFQALAKLLSPAHIRLGGTMSERLIFASDMFSSTSNITCGNCHPHTSNMCQHLKKMCRKKFLPYFVMTATQWTQICKFIHDTNLTLLFSFNVLLRNENSWDDSNARELLEFSMRRGCKHVDWQLGNEPNSFPHTFNVTVTPEQLAKDFQHLRALLNEYGYQNSVLVGPDTTRPQPGRPSCLEYMVQFLGNVSNGNDVRSWHQYYIDSRKATLKDFWDPHVFNFLKNQLEVMENHTKAYFEMPMWLSETSSSYGGGAAGLSNTYSSSPLWLDKLGMSALYNVTTVIRQSLIGGDYSMLDKDLNPLPDWWVSLLYKKLVGNKVLNIKVKSTKWQRLYAHCTSKHYAIENAITLFGMNLQMSKLKFVINGTAFKNNKNMVIEEFILGAPSNNRQSKVLILNDKFLTYDTELPVLKPKVVDTRNGHIVIPPYSIGFWVIKNTSLGICN